MKSETLPLFWVEYRQMSNPVREAARKAYRLWAEIHFIRRYISSALTARKEFGQFA